MSISENAAPELGRWVPRPWFFAIVALVTGWTAHARWSGLDPHSLWYDDLWVAALTKLASIAEAMTTPMPVPPGFAGALWISRRWVDDPELSLQLVPYVVSLATLPLVALLVARVAQSNALGVAAASLMAVNPHVAHYSIFIKQYTTDILATTVLLLAATWFFETRDPFRLRVSTALGVVLLFFSFPSVVTSIPFVTAVVLLEIAAPIGDATRKREVAATVLVFSGLMAAIYWLVISGRSNSDLLRFWAAGFLPTDSTEAALSFLATRGLGFLRGGLPPVLAPALPLAALGLGWLLWHPRLRPVGVLVGLSFLAALVGSALEMYPISGGPPDRPSAARTNLYSYPATIMLFTVGLGGVTRLLPKPTMLNQGLCVAALGGALLSPVRPSYFELDHANFPRLMDAMASEDDGVVIWPNASYLAGFYSKWPITAVPRADLDNELEIHLTRPATLTLPAGPRAAQITALDAFVREGRYRRIIYLTTRSRPNQQAPVFEALQRLGYHEVQRWSSNIRTHLIVYRRAESDTTW